MSHDISTDRPQVAAINQIIRSRRSIKPTQFSGKPVDSRIVREMLENANWAPTHGMTQPWRFFVFTGDAKRELGNRLADFYCEITPGDQIKPGKADKLRTNANASSHLIVIGMKRQQSEKIPIIEEVEAVACAVQNLHLTATAYGVGGYWSSGKAICCTQMRNYLGMQDADLILGLFYVGWPDGPWPESQRDPMEDKVVWHGQ